MKQPLERLQNLHLFQFIFFRHENIRCPDEAEFRSYDVLMNLNSGDTLRTIQNLDKHIRDSPAIQLSLQIFTAINNNNYNRFFKLVRQATLLQGESLPQQVL